MSRKQKIIVSIVGIILVTLILVGLTYGYYLTQINGNTNDKSISVNLANLELTYDDGNGLIEAKNIIPGQTIATKTFTVKNTGNKKISNYAVYLDDVVNTFEDKSDLKLTLSCTSDTGNCNGTTITYPSNNTLLITNDIEEKELQSYELKVEFLETNDDQSDNMNKEMSGNIIINDLKGLNNTIDNVTGTEDIEVDNAQLLSNYRIYGNSVQEGTPSPTNPVEIESVGDLITDTADVNYGKYKIPIKVTGKNLFKLTVNNFKGSGNLNDFSQINNSITINNSNNKDANYFYADASILNLKPGKTYTSKAKIIKSVSNSGGTTAGSMEKVLFLQDNTNFSGNTKYAIVGKSFAQTENEIITTFTLPEDISSLKYIVGRVTGYTSVTFENIIIVEGSYTSDNFPDYEPYQEETTNIYLDEPLRKIGDYSDYIDFKSGKVLRNIRSIIFDGTEDWTKYTTYDFHYQIVVGDNDYGNDNKPRIQSNYYKSYNNYSNNNIDYGVFSADANRIRIKDKNISDLDLWKNKLKEYNSNDNPLRVDYVLKVKKEKSIELPNIYLNSTRNYISIDTSVSSSNVELEYIK